MVRGEILRWLAAQLFSSLPCSGSFLHPSPYGEGAGFRLSWVCPARPQLAHTAPTGPVCGFAGVAPYPALKTAHKAAQGRVWFLPRTNLPLPLKGEGLGIILVGFALLAHNRATLAQQGRSGASLVSFPYPASKTAQRATQGRVWFLLTRWHFSERISCSFSELSCKNSGRRKKSPLPCF